MGNDSWQEALRLHGEAVAEYALAARQVAGTTGLWDTPREEGKWSPAQITLHLIMAFEAVRRELDEGVAMALRTRPWQRLVLRFTIRRRLLRGGAFPQGARSPREARPPTPTEDTPTEDAAVLIGRFEQRAAELTRDIVERRTTHPGTRLTHPYFGRMTLAQTVYASARHIQHHRAQLTG
jgi:hypothetical protein